MSEENNFYPLTPEKGISSEELGKYSDALNYAFNDDNIHNIALSGSYGSGKSSVLGSYENSIPEKRFIHITLAHFDQPYPETDTVCTNTNATGKHSGDDQKGTKYDGGKDRIVNILEEKILNQLLHQIDPKNGPIPKNCVNLHEGVE